MACQTVPRLVLQLRSCWRAVGSPTRTPHGRGPPDVEPGCPLDMAGRSVLAHGLGIDIGREKEPDGHHQLIVNPTHIAPSVDPPDEGRVPDVTEDSGAITEVRWVGLADGPGD